MRWVERHWNQAGLLPLLLRLLGWIFGALVCCRMQLYRSRILHKANLPVPVIVVGNVTAGGTGKTPLVLWLTRFLREQGLNPGIVTRGYGGSLRQAHRVAPDGNARLSGDEPLLLARRSGCPVWAGVDRVAAAKVLLIAEPACNVIVSDDGLQHYRLGRMMEIVSIDADYGFGNGRLLPAGPLREPLSRLAQADAVVLKTGDAASGTGISQAMSGLHSRTFIMRLGGTVFVNLAAPARTAFAGDFHGKRVHAIAGIARPERFFATLQHMGLQFDAHAFDDHHAYQREEIALLGAEAIIMTEKDAVKCAGFADARHWMFPVDAQVDPGLGVLVMERLRQAGSTPFAP